MSDPSLNGILDDGWACLDAACALAGMAHHPVLATVSPAGPQVRTLVLRVADRARGVLEMQTDLGTDKVSELRADPRAQIMVWDVAGLTQVRAACRVDVLTGEAVQGRWEKIPAHRRAGYGAQPTPATPIDAPFDYTKPGDFDGFAVLQGVIDRLEVMQLKEPHRRALFQRDDEWAGQWVVP